MKPVLLVCALMLFGSCCYKSDCDLTVRVPLVTVRCQNFTSQEVADWQIYAVDSNYQVLDSEKNFYADSMVYLSQMLFRSLPYAPLGSYIYISSIAGRRDTISGITCDTTQRREKCESCLGGDNSYKSIISYQNIRFDHNGVAQQSDVLVVHK